MTILGAIIAGGQSSRFGSDKALAMLGDRSLLDHVVVALREQTAEVVVCGRMVAGLHCLDDRPAPDLGPLGGIAAALRHAFDEGHAGVLTSACDTPLVPGDLAARLVGAAAAVVAGQPLFGYWPAALSDALDGFLEDPRNRSMRQWARVAGAREVAYAIDIPNLNTPRDMEALCRLLAA
ncbi:MAG: molybdenum cofactor guanylyltransferase [Sphingomicrobium sp.]